MNLHPGYRCDRCPTGYTGPMTEGVGVEMARTRKQICQDIDECATNNGGCDPYSECINTEVRCLLSQQDDVICHHFDVILILKTSFCH